MAKSERWGAERGARKLGSVDAVGLGALFEHILPDKARPAPEPRPTGTVLAVGLAISFALLLLAFHDLWR